MSVILQQNNIVLDTSYVTLAATFVRDKLPYELH